MPASALNAVLVALSVATRLLSALHLSDGPWLLLRRRVVRLHEELFPVTQGLSTSAVAELDGAFRRLLEAVLAVQALAQSPTDLPPPLRAQAMAAEEGRATELHCRLDGLVTDVAVRLNEGALREADRLARPPLGPPSLHPQPRLAPPLPSSPPSPSAHPPLPSIAPPLPRRPLPPTPLEERKSPQLEGAQPAMEGETGPKVNGVEGGGRAGAGGGGSNDVEMRRLLELMGRLMVDRADEVERRTLAQLEEMRRAALAKEGRDEAAERAEEERRLHRPLEERLVGVPIIPHTELEISTNAKTRVLGKGGFGCVMKAKWTRYGGLEVAVKLPLRLDVDAVERRRFEEEAVLLDRLRGHLNIVTALAVCTEPGHEAIVMKLLKGGNLFKRLEKARKDPAHYGLTWEKKVQWGIDIVRGVNALHLLPPPIGPVLHRDLKSLNVLLDEHDQAWITDFGMSRAEHRDEDGEFQTLAPHQLTGTAHWRAPEQQVLGQKARYNARCDMFSIGMILWELAMEQPPFASVPHSHEVGELILRGVRPAIHDGVPGYFQSWIARCWAQDAGQRPLCGPLLDEMKTVLDGLRAERLQTTEMQLLNAPNDLPPSHSYHPQPQHRVAPPPHPPSPSSSLARRHPTTALPPYAVGPSPGFAHPMAAATGARPPTQSPAQAPSPAPFSPPAASAGAFSFSPVSHGRGGGSPLHPRLSVDRDRLLGPTARLSVSPLHGPVPPLSPQAPVAASLAAKATVESPPHGLPSRAKDGQPLQFYGAFLEGGRRVEVRMRWRLLGSSALSASQRQVAGEACHPSLGWMEVVGAWEVRLDPQHAEQAWKLTVRLLLLRGETPLREAKLSSTRRDRLELLGRWKDCTGDSAQPPWSLASTATAVQGEKMALQLREVREGENGHEPQWGAIAGMAGDGRKRRRGGGAGGGAVEEETVEAAGP